MKLTVNGQDFIIENNEKDVMELFKDLETIEGKEIDARVLDHLEAEHVERVLKLLRLVNCEFPQFGKVKSSDPKEYVGNTINDYLRELSNDQINGLFKTCHYLKIQGMVKSVAAFMACRVYIPLNLDAYNQKMEELKIKKPLTNEVSQAYRAKYTFL